MSRHLFGWDLPPGVTQRMIDEAAGAFDRCEVCARFVDDCICPECPACKEYGNPRCYSSLYEHGWHPLLQRNEAQIIGHCLFKEGYMEMCDDYVSHLQEDM